MAQSNIVLDWGSGSPTERGDLGVGTFIAAISQPLRTVNIFTTFYRRDTYADI